MQDNQQPNSVEYYNYIVYSNGEIFSKYTNRFLTGKVDNVGYKVYALAIGDELRSCSNKKLSKMIYAHRLVAQLFLDNPNNYIYVHHKDGNKLNNDVSNLEWAPSVQNAQYQHKPSKPKYYVKDIEGEEWAIIPDHPNYSVSSMGRVRNNRTNRLLKIDECQRYSRISFSDKKHYYLHRLVYCVFHNDYDLNGFVIDHIDANPRNNKLNNLQKITSQENCLRQKRFND